MEQSEYLELIKRFRRSDSNTERFVLASYFIFQYNLIARVDDVAKFQMADITPNLEYDFILQSKMGWSKNVTEERDAPDQVLLGAMDLHYCVILGLAIHLEHGVLNGHLDDRGDRRLLFGVSKNLASDKLSDIVTAEDFPRVNGKPLGTHSIRKLPATYARRNGCSKDDVNGRGRWKTAQKIVDRYIDVVLPYQDVLVAGVLCVGEPMRYGVKPNSGITSQFILDYCAGRMKELVPQSVALILGTYFLCFDMCFFFKYCVI